MREIKSKNIKWWVGIGACFMLFSIIGIFAYFKMCFLVDGVKIDASLKQKDNSPIAEIVGNAKNSIHLVLNGREIFIDKEGDFSETISLLPEMNVITLNSEDKFGKTVEKKFNIVYKESKNEVAMIN